jgi:hypothetical protein
MFVSIPIFESGLSVYILVLSLRAKLGRKVGSGVVVVFDFENACGDESAGNCRPAAQSAELSMRAISRDWAGERESHATAVSRRDCVTVTQAMMDTVTIVVRSERRRRGGESTEIKRKEMMNAVEDAMHVLITPARAGRLELVEEVEVVSLGWQQRERATAFLEKAGAA